MIFMLPARLVDQPAKDPAPTYLRCREIGDDGRNDLISGR
jgi:hypothetical protein